jgi:hypothetical protein
MSHPARHVPRTRTRLLRAVFVPRALAMQATVATPAPGIAQRAQQASTILQQPMVIARTAFRASTGPLQDKPRRHHARHVPRTRTRLLRAVFVPPALARQDTVATPAQGLAQRA